MPEEDEPLDGELLMPELPEVVLPVPDAPLLLEPDAPEEPLLGVSTVVVVVVFGVVPDALLPDEGLAPDEDVPDGSVVVVVVVVWPNVIVAVPSSDRKMAMGNFFMLAP